MNKEVLDLLDEIDDVADCDPRTMPRRHLAALLVRAGELLKEKTMSDDIEQARLRILLVDPHVLLGALKLPLETELRDVRIVFDEWQGGVQLKLWSPDFEPVHQGEVIPLIGARYRSNEWWTREFAPEEGKVATFVGWVKE